MWPPECTPSHIHRCNGRGSHGTLRSCVIKISTGFIIVKFTYPSVHKECQTCRKQARPVPSSVSLAFRRWSTDRQSAAGKMRIITKILWSRYIIGQHESESLWIMFSIICVGWGWGESDSGNLVGKRMVGFSIVNEDGVDEDGDENNGEEWWRWWWWCWGEEWWGTW